MNDKMMSNDHKMMQIKHQIKDEQKLLKVEQEMLKVKQNELSTAQRQLNAIQQQRYRIQRSISDEYELASINNAQRVKDFFKIESDVVEDGEFLLTDELMSVLKKKLNDKEELLQMIEPIVQHMNGKFYFRLNKRKQKNELKSLHKQLSKDINNLNKAIQLFV